MATTLIEDPVFRLFIDAGGPGAVAVLGWWLAGKFRKVEENARSYAEAIGDKAEAAIDRHEAIDQSRHEENLKNLKEINGTINSLQVRMARAGINGHD